MVVELRHQCNMNSYRPWTSRNNSVAMVEGSKFAVLSGKAGIHEFLGEDESKNIKSPSVVSHEALGRLSWNRRVRGRLSWMASKANVIAALLSLLQSSLSSCIQRRDGSGRRKVKGPCILQLAMVDVWWSLLGAAIPAVIAGQAFRMKKKHAEEQRMKSARGREKSSDDIFVCERVCTSKRMLKKVGAFSKDPIPDTCVTVCGVSELDACSDACARTVCVNQHQVPNWNDICLRRCQSECLRLSASNYS
ncbi:hypothetical protein V6N13_028559 [Hibiscus sabdariffa]